LVAQPYLKWKDVEFWVGRNEYGDLTIFCLVLSKWLKTIAQNLANSKLSSADYRHPKMVFQDSCRLLVILAFHFGYFKDFKTWDELMSANPGPYGARILLKD